MRDEAVHAAGLRADGITVRYGGVTAVNEVSLEVPPGRVVGLIGPNGAGKTSMVDALTGFVEASGEVTLNGKRISGLRPHQRHRAGLSRTWQSSELFSSLSVGQNVLSSARPVTLRTLWSDLFSRRQDDDSLVDAVLSRVGLRGMSGAQAGSLPLGQQKLVGVARALAGNCSALLLDEPAAGLDGPETMEFAGRIREIVGDGLGVLLIDHDMDLVQRVCDIVYVLEFGRLIFIGPPSTLRGDPAVVAAYLGSEGELTNE